MLLAQGLSGPQLILLGLSFLAAAFVWRRMIALGRRSRERDVAAEVRREFADAEKSGQSLLRRMEVRLYDYDRELEGRLQTRTAVLNQLLIEADREIARLEDLLSRSRGIAPADESGTLPSAGTAAAGPPADDSWPGFLTDAGTTPEQRRLIARLFQSGYQAAEIAELLRRHRVPEANDIEAA